MLSMLNSHEIEANLKNYDGVIIIVKDDNNLIDEILEENVKRILNYNHSIMGCITDIEEFNKLVHSKQIKYNKISIGNVYFIRNNEIIKLPYLCRKEKMKEYIC